MFIWICALSSALASEIRAADEIDLQTFRDEYKSAEQRWLQKFDSLNIDGTLEVWVGEKREYLDDVNYQSRNGSVLVSKASARRKYKTILPKSGWDFRVDGDEGSLVVSEIRKSKVSLRSRSERGDLVERFVFAPLLSLDGVVVSSVLAEADGWKVLEILELPNGNVFVKASHELLKERKFQFSSVTFELAKSYDYGVINYAILYGFPNEEQSTVLGTIEYMNSDIGIYPSYVEMDELKRRR